MYTGCVLYYLLYYQLIIYIIIDIYSRYQNIEIPNISTKIKVICKDKYVLHYTYQYVLCLQ